MICPKCGRALEDNAKFCDKCGSRVDVPVQQQTDARKFCAVCGTPLSANAKFCAKCGTAYGTQGSGTKIRPAAALRQSAAEPGKKKGGPLMVIVILLVLILAAGGGAAAFMAVNGIGPFGGSAQKTEEPDSSGPKVVGSKKHEEKKDDKPEASEKDEEAETPASAEASVPEITAAETAETETAESETAVPETAASETMPAFYAPGNPPSDPSAQPGEYVLPGSDSRYITESELYGLSKEQCRLARNELYARHGRIFMDAALTQYFSQFSWYHPMYSAEQFKDEMMLNQYELANRDVIVAYEKKMGYN